MVPLAYFGINSSAFSVAIDLLIVFLVVIWIALVYWTFADARRRIEDPMLVGCATAAALFPFVGSIVYTILRPPEYLEDVRERELEMQAAEARLSALDYGLCPHCDYRIERDFLRCPSCLRRLKERCGSCGRPLEQSWTICPYCEAEVAVPAAPTRTRRRRSRALEAEDLLGETVEADQLALAEDGVNDGATPVPGSEIATDLATSRPRASRRPTTTRQPPGA